MSFVQNPSPARRYVNAFLLAMCSANDPVRRIKRSDGLPSVELFPDPPPPFEQCRNRLKIMAQLDPVIYPTPKVARFEINVGNDEAGGMRERQYAVHATFDDAASDPSVELRAELLWERFLPGVTSADYL